MLSPNQPMPGPARDELLASELETEGFLVLPALGALTAHGITATALHSHLIGEQPRIYYMHFWADAPLVSGHRRCR